MRIQVQSETFGYRLAVAPDWRPNPNQESKHVVNMHSMPMENGDKLHVYQPASTQAVDQRPTERWVHEIEPHDLPPRHPLPDVNPTLLEDEHHPTPHSSISNLIARDFDMDPRVLNTDPSIDYPVDPNADPLMRRNISLRGKPSFETGAQNPRTFPSKEDAMDAVEQRYREHAPLWPQREPHQRDDIGMEDQHDPFAPPKLDDDYGSIF